MNEKSLIAERITRMISGEFHGYAIKASGHNNSMYGLFISLGVEIYSPDGRLLRRFSHELIKSDNWQEEHIGKCFRSIAEAIVFRDIRENEAEQKDGD